jgi:hypothetical protein
MDGGHRALWRTLAEGFVPENQGPVGFNGQCLLALSPGTATRAVCGTSFTAACNVGWLPFPASPFSDKRGAATRKASTSISSLDSSSSFCLRTSITFFMQAPGKFPESPPKMWIAHSVLLLKEILSAHDLGVRRVFHLYPTAPALRIVSPVFPLSNDALRKSTT